MGRTPRLGHFAIPVILRAAWPGAVRAPTVEAGFDTVRTISGIDLDDGILADAVAGCLRDGLIHDPVRLLEGALQCHWHLELTPKGVAAAAALGEISDDKQSMPESRTLC